MIPPNPEPLAALVYDVERLIVSHTTVPSGAWRDLVELRQWLRADGLRSQARMLKRMAEVAQYGPVGDP